MFTNYISKWWMALDPAQQYMYWIISFIFMLGGGVIFIVALTQLEMMSVAWMIVVGGGIFGFVGFFMLVVLFLTVIWPHLYQGYNNVK